MRLPQGWTSTSLGELGRLASGSTPSKARRDFWGGTTPWVSPKDMKVPTLDDAGDHVTDLALRQTNLGLLPPGSLLIVVRSGILAHTLPVAVTQVPVTINQDLKALPPVDGVEPAFLAWYFRSANREILQTCTKAGTTVSSVRTEALLAHSVPLAPLPEQHRIVAKIEELFSELDAGVAALERAQAKLERYRASVLKAAVEGKLTEQWRAENGPQETGEEMLHRTPTPARPSRYKSRAKGVVPGHAGLSVGPVGSPLPPGWAWAPLVDVARLESGHTPSRRHPEWWGGDIPWIGIKDGRAHHGSVIHDTFQYTNEEGLAHSAARLLPGGTVCLSRTASVGYVVVLGRPMATSQDFVNWICTDALNPRWLQIVFQADPGVLRRFGKGSTHTTIYFPEVLSFHVALPPRAEQDAIVEEADRLLTLASAQRLALRRTIVGSATLRQSILKRAFEGRLVQQDPNNEPASVLLERISAERDSAPPKKTRRSKKTKAPQESLDP